MILSGRRYARLLIVTGIVAVLSSSRASALKPFSISIKGNLTTASQLFPYPNSPDEVQRAQYFSLKGIWGYSVELRYRFPETDVAVAVSADYLRATTNSSIRLSGTQISVEDGYSVIPVELTGYFLIPISGEVFGVFMGGGGGAYFGRRIYRIGNTEAPSVARKVGFGIHVMSGLGYRFADFFSVVAEMKFRDLQFSSVNRFGSSQIQNGSTFVIVETTPFESTVHTDGMIIQLGVIIDF